MYQQFITDIVVDGANNKWISTLDAGVFLFSPNGQETLHHFTSSNSPLPSNNVSDIDINSATGEVFFATINGMVSFKGTAIKASNNLDNVVVYPNPVVYSNFKGKVTIKGLAEKTNIRIADVAGNVVHSAVARGGYYEWDLNNQRGTRVASGIYFVLMTNEDGSDKATAKIAVVN